MQDGRLYSAVLLYGTASVITQWHPRRTRRHTHQHSRVSGVDGVAVLPGSVIRPCSQEKEIAVKIRILTDDPRHPHTMDEKAFVPFDHHPRIAFCLDVE